jgi:hypothetical protein
VREEVQEEGGDYLRGGEGRSGAGSGEGETSAARIEEEGIDRWVSGSGRSVGWLVLRAEQRLLSKSMLC